MDNVVELSLIIPVLNGASFLKSSLDKLALWTSQQTYSIEIIFVNDGSSDKTQEILNNFHGLKNVAVINFIKNLGKGAAIKAGLSHARGAYVVFTDADLPYGLDVFDGMLNKIKSNHSIALVYGSRSHEQSIYKEGYGFGRRLGRFFFSALIRLIIPIGVADTQSGIKLFRRDLAMLVAEKLTVHRFAFDVEIFAIAKQNNFSYVDFPVTLSQRKETSVHFIKDTLNMIKDIFKIRYLMFCNYYTLNPKP